MTKRSVGRVTTAPGGGRTGGRTGSRGGRTIGQSGDQGNDRIDGQGSHLCGKGSEVNDGIDGVPDFSIIIAQQLQNLLPTILTQVGNKGSNQGNPKNQNGDTVNDNIQGDVRNVILNNNQRGCTYKEFLAYNRKEYDRKGGAIVYTQRIEKMESVQDMSGCEENQKVKYTPGSFFSKALTRWNTLIHSRRKEAIVGMSWEDFKNLTKEEFCPVNKMQKLKTEGNGEEPNRDRNVRDKNKRTRTGNAFATTTNLACFNCGHPRLMAKDCRVAPRMVNSMNAKNPTAAPGACYECGGSDHFKAACPSFISTAFTPRLGIESSNLGFSYEIEIASGQLVEINKEEHEIHLGLVLELLKKEKLHAKFSKYEFWLQEVQFLRHVINGDGIHVDPSKIEAVRN
nr:reverse transcriptase domain-containing protein [Tanacetum cinerariifolium]